MLSEEVRAKLARVEEIRAAISSLEAELEGFFDNGAGLVSSPANPPTGQPEKPSREHARVPRGKGGSTPRPAQETSKRGIPPETKERIVELARAGKNIQEILAGIGDACSGQSVRNVLAAAGVKAAKVPRVKKEKKAEASSLDERILFSEDEYGKVKSAHFQRGVSPELLRMTWRKQGIDEIRRAIKSQNYREYIQPDEPSEGFFKR